MSDYRRKPNWVDYANLTANLIQVGEIAAVNSRLDEIREIETAREERARLLDQLRQMVFDTEDDLEQMGKYITRAPAGIYTVIQILTKIYDEAMIVPQTFKEFIDKDRVKKIRNTMQSLYEGAACQLDVSKRTEIDNYLYLSYHLNELEALIQHQKIREELSQLQILWGQLEKEYAVKVKPWSNRAIKAVVGMSLGTLLSCFLPTFLGTAIQMWAYSNQELLIELDKSVQSSPYFWNSLSLALPYLLYIIPCMTFVLFPIILLIYYLVRRSEAVPANYRKVKFKIYDLNRQLLSPERFTTYSKRFGEEKTWQEYTKMKEQIQSFISHLILFDKNNQPLPEGALRISIR